MLHVYERSERLTTQGLADEHESRARGDASQGEEIVKIMIPGLSKPEPDCTTPIKICDSQAPPENFLTAVR